jgi:hypothetical protein
MRDLNIDNIGALRLLCLGFMETTLTLDDDVAAVLEWLCKAQGESQGTDQRGSAPRLSEMTGPRRRRESLRTRAISLGGLRIASISNIGDALAVAEGENFR